LFRFLIKTILRPYIIYNCVSILKLEANNLAYLLENKQPFSARIDGIEPGDKATQD